MHASNLVVEISAVRRSAFVQNLQARHGHQMLVSGPQGFAHNEIVRLRFIQLHRQLDTWKAVQMVTIVYQQTRKKKLTHVDEAHKSAHPGLADLPVELDGTCVAEGGETPKVGLERANPHVVAIFYL